MPPASALHAPRSLWLLPCALVLLAVGLQLIAWTGVSPPLVRDQPALGVLEMILLVALVANGWCIRQWVRVHRPALGALATLVLLSLALCVLGDLVNRNFAQQFFRHEAVIEHSYLVDSVWFFLPGYALWLVAAWQATRALTPAWLQAGSLLAGALAGVATFQSLAVPGMSAYSSALTGAYTVLISLMAVAAAWIALAFGRRGLWVATGAMLATVADALIGHFWLFGSGHYPAIAYLNFAVYFLSQALIQRLPLLLAETRRAD